MKKKVFLFDWGNTMMRDFPDEKGKMSTWQKVEAMPNAVVMLQNLSQKVDCYIATNAKDSDKEDIIKALQRVSLHEYFKDVFCYKEIGFLKPSKEYFDAILEKLQVSKSEIMMVGDNLEADVQGAEEYGIDAVFYDCENKHLDYPGARVADLLELTEEKSL